MKRLAGIIILFLLPCATMFAQEERVDKLPPLFKERRNGKVMFDREQAVHEVNRERLEHSKAILAKWEGKPCPVFACKDLNGKEWTNETIRGKVTLINFWHSGSGPCVREMPWLNKLMEKNPQANFLACTYNTPAQIKKIVVDTPFLYTQLASAISVWHAIGVELVPTTIIIDKEGKVFAVVTGFNDGMKRKIETKLKEANK